MRFVNNHILVKFDEVQKVGGLIIPERYLIQEEEKEGKSYGVTTDRRLINPQTCTNVLTGERLFVHYGAYEVRKDVGDGTSLIPERMVLFLLDPVRPISGTYIGEAVYSDDIRTAGGIILKEGNKEGVKVRICYSSGRFEVGDIVITTDPYQYTFRYEDKSYILVTDEIIIGIEWDGVEPLNGCLLVEYLPDTNLKERIEENDRRARLRDFLEKNYLHYQVEDIEPLPEPKTVNARCIKGDLAGEELLVLRNYGCKVGDQWLVRKDNVLAKIDNDLVPVAL